MKKKEVDKIFQTAKFKIKNSWFDLILAPRSLDGARLVVVTPKKVGNAPKRNQIRRRLKSIFHEEKMFNLPYDCVIVVRNPNVFRLGFSQLKELLIAAIKNDKNS